MIKVLVHGDQYRIRKCDRCGCVFEFEDEDIKSTQGWYKGFKTDLEYVTCPECGKYVHIMEGI